MATEEVSNERWNKAVIGVSNDFLRISVPRTVQESLDRQVAYAHQQQLASNWNPVAANICGRLSITVAQAKLVKNYGLTRMDPYVRVRCGHFVYETQTDPNGGKIPRWNRVFHTQLPKGVNTISLEIYDECNFTMDEIIAWGEIKIPPSVLAGETHEDWYPLSGKSGEGREGMIDLVLSFTAASAVNNCVYQPANQPVVLMPNVSGRAMPVYVQPPPQQQQPMIQQQMPEPIPVQPLTEEEINQISEMFPTIEKEVIKSIAEANRGNKDLTINSLLTLTN
ncbi:unnamed protein product [Diamesa serratosioi]